MGLAEKEELAKEAKLGWSAYLENQESHGSQRKCQLISPGSLEQGAKRWGLQ